MTLIEENLRHCGVRTAMLLSETPQSLLSGSFDLVVLDPPYDEPDLTASIAAAERRAPDGLLVLEHARRGRRRTGGTAGENAGLDVRRQRAGILLMIRN